jgi:hypothetical protein
MVQIDKTGLQNWIFGMDFFTFVCCVACSVGEKNVSQGSQKNQKFSKRVKGLRHYYRTVFQLSFRIKNIKNYRCVSQTAQSQFVP